ncbi:hypothetical protein AX16_006046 [Volvariella volvacea WC 439]|nr:hypothetical protein AX16_006046 [Volvariella volvacea WC 439]
MVLSARIATRIAELDAEIATLHAQLVELQRRRNSLLPISTLPSELVVDILKYIITDAVEQTERASNSGTSCCRTRELNAHNWIRVTHRYARWREIALGCPTLWNQIWATSRGRFRAFAERAVGQLLQIDTAHDLDRRAELGDIYNLLADNMHRTHTLHLLVTDMIPWWLNTVPAPALEVLRIYFRRPLCSGVVSEIDKVDWEAIELMEMPKLRQLEVLEDVPQGWYNSLSSDLSTVTKATLYFPFFELVDCHDFLQRMPALQDLLITLACTFIALPPQPLVLSHLRRFVVHNPVWSYLQMIQVPSIQEVTIVESLDKADSTTLQDTFQSLKQFLEPFCDTAREQIQPHRASLFSTDTGSVLVKFMDTAGRDRIMLDLTPPDYMNEAYIFFNQLAQFAEQINSQIDSINLDTLRGWESNSVADLFHSFRGESNINDIRLCSFRAFLLFLSLPYVSHHVYWPYEEEAICNCDKCHETLMTCYTSLNTLVLDLDGIETAEVQGSHGWECFELLINFLEQRRQRGHTLNTLKLICGVDKQMEGKDVDRLSRAVTNLIIENSTLSGG